jgi:hypothetical protein
MRTVVTFESDAFNTSERRDYFINDCGYGDDAARWLMGELRARGVSTADEPGQEDFGWYFSLRAGATDYHLIVGYRPPAPPDPGVWIGWLERKVRFPGPLLGAHKRKIGVEAADAIHAALVSSPRVTRVRWHHPHDFDAGREERGAPEPTAP